MKYAVTGGAGFIGGHIARHLLDRGHSVTVIDSNDAVDLEGRVELHRADIRDAAALRRALDGTDGVFHQAALVSVQESFSNQELYHQVNVNGTENVLAASLDLGIKTVWASSSSIYGDATSLPIGEDSVRDPVTPYGETKAQGEVLADKYASMGARIVSLRYFNVYGRGQSAAYAGVITGFYNRIESGKPPVIFGDGSHTRDYVHVEDVARANLMAMESPADSCSINIGTGIETSVLELARMMIKLSGADLEPEFADPPGDEVAFSRADTALARQLIGWSHSIELEEGLRKSHFGSTRSR
ncbi:nucleoside-diphosphate-sugar epimerase [Cenarchaeum symbiosum A]|uniref:Nucleoside-diphosphate-sugar epimerase n=1 Tax=Cenarchaeum symbiosum (strain A) TaxID=414004 RepID=A0RWB8_CENSY|nr:nucleoside-diphosphate-sugar epimerase [Cenarchaeum symbiosum A]